MKTLIALLSAIIFTLPAYAQKFPKVNLTGAIKASNKAAQIPSQLTKQVSSTVLRTGQQLSVGLSNTTAKQILNRHYRFQLESSRAANLLQQLQTPAFDPAQIRQIVDQTIVNNTLRTSLLENLDRENIAGMKQDLSQYFQLSVTEPFSPAAREAFVADAGSYLQTHPLKPTWRLRETLQFGGMHDLRPRLMSDAIKMTPQAASTKNGLELEETQQLFSLYDRAEDLSGIIKKYVGKTTHTDRETAAFSQALEEMHALYADLLTLAKNSRSVQNTIKIYETLLADTEAIVAKHHRLPVWDNPEERPLAQIFDPLLFNNQSNQFEEIIPILNKLYILTETYPAKRFPENEAFFHLKNFYDKHGFLPRSVHERDFFDARPQEALMFETLTYWTRHSASFVQKVNALVNP